MAIGTRQTIAIGTDEIPKVLESVAADDTEIADVVVVDQFGLKTDEPLAAETAEGATSRSGISLFKRMVNKLIDVKALLGTIDADTSALAAAVTACNTGAVTVAASSLPTGAATQTTLSALNDKVTACNTGAVAVASSALPTGAATAAKQPALGTAGTPSADVITVQGVSGGTTLPVTATAGNTLVPVAATIAESGSLSTEVDLGAGRILCGIDMPADWTAANLTFQASYNTGGTFDNLYDQYGNEKNITAAEDRYIALDDPAFWLGVRYLKVRSGTAASAVNQGAARTIQLITKPV